MVLAGRHLAVLTLCAVGAGCSSSPTGGGGGGGGGSTTILGAVPKPDDYSKVITDLTPDDTVITKEADLPTGTATYYGVTNLSLEGRSDVYLGGTTLAVDFGKDTMTGDIKDFRMIPLLGGTSTTVSGSIDFIDTVLTGTNEAGTSTGIEGQAEGTVDGVDLDLDVSGGFRGAKGEIISLGFADAVTSSGGFAFLSE